MTKQSTRKLNGTVLNALIRCAIKKLLEIKPIAPQYPYLGRYSLDHVNKKIRESVNQSIESNSITQENQHIYFERVYAALDRYNFIERRNMTLDEINHQAKLRGKNSD